jgi:hypothetical protein
MPFWLLYQKQCVMYVVLYCTNKCVNLVKRFEVVEVINGSYLDICGKMQVPSMQRCSIFELPTFNVMQLGNMFKTYKYMFEIKVLTIKSKHHMGDLNHNHKVSTHFNMKLIPTMLIL